MNKPIKELKQNARGSLIGRYGITMSAMLLVNLLPSLVLIPFNMMLDINIPSQMAIYYLATFVISLLTVVLSAGDVYLHLNIARKKPCKISDVFHCFKERPDCYILAFLLLFVKLIPYMIPALVVIIAYVITENIILMVAGIVLYIIGLVLMVIAALGYSQIYLILVDQPYQKLRDVFAQSKTMMKGFKKKYFLLQLSFIGFMLLGILSLGIGYLWIIPYMTQTQVAFYLDLTGETN